jgi:hypothetical protein
MIGRQRLAVLIAVVTSISIEKHDEQRRGKERGNRENDI